MVNDNHMDNYLKDILTFVYYGSARPNKKTVLKMSSAEFFTHHAKQ